MRRRDYDGNNYKCDKNKYQNDIDELRQKYNKLFKGVKGLEDNKRAMKDTRM